MNDLHDFNEKAYLLAKSFPNQGVCMVAHFKFFGSTTVGERGQIVLPVELRKKLKISPGDKLLVLGSGHTDSGGVFLVKGEVLTGIMAKLEQNISQILKENENENEFPDGSRNVIDRNCYQKYEINKKVRRSCCS